MSDKKKQENVQSTCIYDFKEHGQILALHWSKFAWSENVLLLAFHNKILIVKTVIEDDYIKYSILGDVVHEYRCHALAVSPESTLVDLPRIVSFASADNDFKIRLFNAKLGADGLNATRLTEHRELSGHIDYINEINYDPEDNFLASVSDDNTARLWDTNDLKCVTVFYLSSPGISTNWHREDTSKLMVAEKIGILRFYNVQTYQPIMSLDYGKPLAGAHWAPSDSQLVGSLQQGELILWDMTRPSLPSHTKLVYSEAGGNVKFSSSGELVATMNRHEGSVSIFQVGNQQLRHSFPVIVPSNISWHFRDATLAVGNDTKLIFCKITK